MVANYTVADAGVQDYVTNGGVAVTRYRRMRSAVLDAVAASGGQVYSGLAPIDTSIPVFSGQAPIVGTTESLVGGSVSVQSSSVVAGHMSLLVKAHGEVERTTEAALSAQLAGASNTAGMSTRMAAQKLPAIFGGFDADHLKALAALSTTDIEWTAADPIAAISAAFAVYDETPYNGDAVILTRKGARLLGLSVDGNDRLQFTGPLETAFPVDVPIFRTDANAVDINLSNILAIIGPFSSCAVGESGSTTIKVFDQLEATNGGAQENIISFKVQRYMGFVHPLVAAIPATGWVTITDDA